MKTRKVALKVKIKSLQEEAWIIRKEEKKNPDLKVWLADHRRGTVRTVAFHSQLAYGFLRGRDFDQIAPNCKTPIDWRSVKSMVDRYGVYFHDDPELTSETNRASLRRETDEQHARFELWKEIAEKE